MNETWRQNLVEDPEEIRRLARGAQRVAVLGIRSEACADRPAHYVARSLAEGGAEIIPVPVYEPEVSQILGRPVWRNLGEVPGPVDIVDVFRRPEDIPAHIPDLLKLRPKAVWFQSGIRHPGAAETLARAGIRVVQDRCLMVERR